MITKLFEIHDYYDDFNSLQLAVFKIDTKYFGYFKTYDTTDETEPCEITVEEFELMDRNSLIEGHKWIIHELFNNYQEFLFNNEVDILWNDKFLNYYKYLLQEQITENKKTIDILSEITVELKDRIDRLDNT